MLFSITLGCVSDPLSIDSEFDVVDWPDVAVEHVEETPDEQAWIFNRKMVHSVELTIADEGIDSLWADPSEYVEATATFDGADLGVVGIRLKGRIGSFRTLDKKSGFKMDLNRFQEGNRFHGLEQMTFNNSVTDCSYMKEHLGYQIYRDAGVAASRNGYTEIRLNGALYGLYVITETTDDRWLKRSFDEPEGNLYDGKYLWYGGYNYTLLDFHPSLADSFQLEEGLGPRDDINDMVDVVHAASTSGSFYEDTAGVVNWERQHRQVAVAQWIGHVDGYSMNQNNYRVYYDPGDDLRATIVPWDLDYAFIRDSAWGKSWNSPQGLLSRYCRADDACWEAQGEAMASLLGEVIDERAYLDLLEDTQDMLEPYIEADPRRECGMSDHNSASSALRTWVRGRDEAMEDFWDL